MIINKYFLPEDKSYKGTEGPLDSEGVGWIILPEELNVEKLRFSTRMPLEVSKTFINDGTRIILPKGLECIQDKDNVLLPKYTFLEMAEGIINVKSFGLNTFRMSTKLEPETSSHIVDDDEMERKIEEAIPDITSPAHSNPVVAHDPDDIDLYRVVVHHPTKETHNVGSKLIETDAPHQYQHSGPSMKDEVTLEDPKARGRLSKGKNIRILPHPESGAYINTADELSFMDKLREAAKSHTGGGKVNELYPNVNRDQHTAGYAHVTVKDKKGRDKDKYIRLVHSAVHMPKKSKALEEDILWNSRSGNKSVIGHVVDHLRDSLDRHMKEYDENPSENLKHLRDRTALTLTQMLTGLRPGENKASMEKGKPLYGALTMQGRHVSFDNKGNVQIRLRAKADRDNYRTITDPTLKRFFRQRMDEIQKSAPQEHVEYTKNPPVDPNANYYGFKNPISLEDFRGSKRIFPGLHSIDVKHSLLGAEDGHDVDTGDYKPHHNASAKLTELGLNPSKLTGGYGIFRRMWDKKYFTEGIRKALQDAKKKIGTGKLTPEQDEIAKKIFKTRQNISNKDLEKYIKSGLEHAALKTQHTASTIDSSYLSKDLQHDIVREFIKRHRVGLPSLKKDKYEHVGPEERKKLGIKSTEHGYRPTMEIANKIMGDIKNIQNLPKEHQEALKKFKHKDIEKFYPVKLNPKHKKAYIEQILKDLKHAKPK